ncbi:hypothetical protein RUM44_009015 [Polyplax serrata]|uniref:Protein sleepless n=1 Tax=Polyplax serrata TaxID=468196 RepID=A0ABR1ARH7_POLSC
MIARLIFLFMIIVAVESIKCYRCTSTATEKDPYQCNEFFDDSELEPQSCDDIHNAQYCIKQIGIFEAAMFSNHPDPNMRFYRPTGALETKRFCSSLYLGNYCHYNKQPGGRTHDRSCYFTCQGDGCNSAINVRISLLSFTTIGYLLLILTVR